jgi:hypothetical protein
MGSPVLSLPVETVADLRVARLPTLSLRENSILEGETGGFKNGSHPRKNNAPALAISRRFIFGLPCAR